MIKIKRIFGYYYIDYNGNIYSKVPHNNGRIKKISVHETPKGYMYVSLYDVDNKKTFAKQLHRLVAERFYSHIALSGFGELNLTPVYEDGKAQIKSEIKITNKPQAILGEVISAKLQRRK